MFEFATFRRRVGALLTRRRRLLAWVTICGIVFWWILGLDVVIVNESGGDLRDLEVIVPGETVRRELLTSGATWRCDLGVRGESENVWIEWTDSDGARHRAPIRYDLVRHDTGGLTARIGERRTGTDVSYTVARWPAFWGGGTVSSDPDAWADDWARR